MSEQAAKKTRTKVEGPRAHLVVIAGKEWLLTLDSVRVATATDLNRALDGVLPRAKIEAANTSAKS